MNKKFFFGIFIIGLVFLEACALSSPPFDVEVVPGPGASASSDPDTLEDELELLYVETETYQTIVRNYTVVRNEDLEDGIIRITILDGAFDAFEIDGFVTNPEQQIYHAMGATNEAICLREDLPGGCITEFYSESGELLARYVEGSGVSFV